MSRPLILASTSRYRQELLARLRIPFDVRAPQIDETALSSEAPRSTALRLAREKAMAVAREFPEAVVIGSDQIAEVDSARLNKPLAHSKAVEQLRSMSGKRVEFHSAMAVICMVQAHSASTVVPTFVQMRTLSDDQIEHYLLAEQPYDCAGSAKAEGLGITLISAIESDDPTALIGLPLIKLCDMLREVGYPLP